MPTRYEAISGGDQYSRTCNAQTWASKYQHDPTCGDCSAVVYVRDNIYANEGVAGYGTCEVFCEGNGLECVEGRDDEVPGTCSEGATVRPCDHQYTDDQAVCTCKVKEGVFPATPRNGTLLVSV